MKTAFKKLLVLPLLFASSVTLAQTYNFAQLLGNSNADVGSQLTLDVTNSSGNALFTFTNPVGTPSSITAIYFDDTTNLFSSVSNDVLGAAGESAVGVTYSDGASPSNLPQGNTIGFFADFSGQSANPGITNGVDASGEYAAFLGTLSGLASFSSVISALDLGELRIGLSVQSTQGRGADRYELARPIPSAVPLPAAAWLFMSGLGLFGIGKKRSKL